MASAVDLPRCVNSSLLRRYIGYWHQRPYREVTEGGRSMALSTLTSRSAFYKVDAQRMRSTGHRGESRETCDQLATSHHWITSSARSSTLCGIVIPSALAIFRLTNNSIF